MAGTKILRQIGPVAIGAHPDLHERGLVLDHGPVTCGGERGDAGAGPDQRERTRHLPLPLITDPHLDDVPFVTHPYFAFFHSSPDGVPTALPTHSPPFLTHS